MALRRPRRRDGGSADCKCGLAARSDPRGSRSKAGTGGAAEAQRPARARRTLLWGSRLAKHRFLRAIVCFQDVARRKISTSIFFVMSIPPRPARWAAPFEGRRRFQFCIERFQDIRRLFLQLPKTGISSFSRLGCPGRARSPAVPDVVGPRLPRPYHFRARIQSFQTVAAPFPGDSARRPSAGFRSLPAFPKVADFSAAPMPCFPQIILVLLYPALAKIPTQRAGLQVSRILAEFEERAERGRVVRDR